MGLWDVVCGRQSLGSWLTGRDPAESDVYAHYELVGAVSEELRTIASTSVGNAQESIYSALNALNSVNGMEYVGTITVGNYDSVFETVSDTIIGLADQLEGKASDIKKYEESPWYEKVGSTFVMSVCKVGEGLLSVVEDLGDGVMSLTGWVAGNVFGDKEAQNRIADAIKTEWSHDAFNFYYNSDFAKASAITEDSAIAGACKIAGKAVGYLYAGGFLAGGMGALGVGSSFLGASSTTWAATAVAGLGGLGSGTESGLNAGMDYNSAFKVGLKEGGKQAALAFAGGKLGEKLAKNAAIKDAKAGLAKAQDAVDDLSDDFIEGSFSKTAESSAKTFEAYGQLDDATEALAKLQGMKNYQFQGYSDAVTKAGMRAGETTVNTVKSGINYLGKTARAAIGGSPVGHMNQLELANARNASYDALDDFLANGKKLLTQDNALVQGAQGLKSMGSNAASHLSGLRHPIQSAKNVLSSAKNAVAHPATTLKAAGSAAIQAAKNVSPALPGVVAISANSTNNVPGFDLTPNEFGGVASLSTPTDQQLVYGPPTPTKTPVGGTTVQPPVNPIPEPDTQIDTQTPADPSKPSGPAGGPSTPYTPSIQPATTAPITTAPITSAPITSAPITSSPITSAPTTAAPITSAPITSAPTTSSPYTPGPAKTPSHDGGGYGEDGFTDKGTALTASVADLLDDSEKSIDEIIKGTQYSRVPTTTKPILSSGKKGGSSAVIPIAAGLSVASAAGLGAKAYMDYKKAEEEDEEEGEFEEDDDFAADSWTEDEDTLAIEGEGQDGEFVNQDLQADDEYYRTTDNPFPIMGSEELEEF